MFRITVLCLMLVSVTALAAVPSAAAFSECVEEDGVLRVCAFDGTVGEDPACEAEGSSYHGSTGASASTRLADPGGGLATPNPTVSASGGESCANNGGASTTTSHMSAGVSTSGDRFGFPPSWTILSVGWSHLDTGQEHCSIRVLSNGPAGFVSHSEPCPMGLAPGDLPVPWGGVLPDA